MLHYTDCGLRNIWLKNGYRHRKTPYGPGTAIEDLPGLHRAIGLWIVRSRPRLTGAELRFLRKELDISQKRLAEILGVEEQTVSLWERRGKMPKMADRFARALYREHAEGNAKIQDIVERLAAKDKKEREARRAEFARKADEWRAAA